VAAPNKHHQQIDQRNNHGHVKWQGIVALVLIPLNCFWLRHYFTLPLLYFAFVAPL
jgi:hypothetical protein